MSAGSGGDTALRPWPVAAWIVARFQLGRLVTWPRLAMAAACAIVPAAVILVVRRTTRDTLPPDLAVILMYALIPETVCILGPLVTMCPAVADELERGTWPHVAARPYGRRALLVGNWLAAVIWTGAVGIAATILAVLVTRLDEPVTIGGLIAALVLLSGAGRAALFALPAVVLPKRALVASVGLALIVEVLAGTIPAVVNQATVSLRLRSLLVHWMGWRDKVPVEMQLFVDPRPPAVHLVAVGVLVVLLLAAAVFILERREFPPGDEL